MLAASSLAHLANRPLLTGLAEAVGNERTALVVVLAYVAEVDARRLFLQEGHPSMYMYCVQHLKLSEQGAYRRIRAARLARRFPVLFTLVAEGRLHLSAITLLAPHIRRRNAEELFAAAEHKTKQELQQLLADRFPHPDLPTRVRVLVAPLSARPVEGPAGVAPSTPAWPVAGSAASPDIDVRLAPGRVEHAAPPTIVMPVAPRRYALEVPIDQETHDLLRRAQELLRHQLPEGDVAEVLRRGLQLLVKDLEKRKFALTDRPRDQQPRACTSRHVPALVRRAVRKRDGGQCTFVSEAGQRCSARGMLEFDHIQPVTLGGAASIDNIRLRCRAHNQFDADQVFGAGLMARKREEARTFRAGRP
jgi:HNH endonuclease